MELFEEKIKVYVKAGLSKSMILEKIQKEFGDESKEYAKKAIDKYFKKSSPYKKKIITWAILFFIILIIIYIIYPVYLSNNSFDSNKCPLAKNIQITGKPMYREKIVEYLTIIQENNCKYLEFVSENIPKIDEVLGAETVSSKANITNSFVSNNISKIGEFLSSKTASPEAKTAESYEENNEWRIMISNETPLYHTGLIIHKACHGYQRNNNKQISEPDCQLTELEYLLRINAPQQEVNIVLKRPSKYPIYVYSEENIDVFDEWVRNK
ncbi:MAG: hypothetical protein NTY48_07295 [Candidatus Diapherotrites archaeon]|nr:hypothetical protein [Candidatus Diapherotrites archaeon]